MHTNLTTCETVRYHPIMVHFKKVPCGTIIHSRSLITLGVSITRGYEIKGIHDLMTCIKKCSTAGNGIAPLTADYLTLPQLCVGLDFDFGKKKCFFHDDITLCVTANTLTTPLRTIATPGNVNILICSVANT